MSSICDPSNCFRVNEVSGIIPGNPSLATIWRWILKGAFAPNGERIKLASFRVGKSRHVTREAVEAFITACNDVPPLDSKPAPENKSANGTPSAQTHRQRLNASERKPRKLRVLQRTDRKGERAGKVAMNSEANRCS